MKSDLELKIQAWVDGELSESEAAQMAEWIAGDQEAGAVASSLGQVKKAIAANEPPVSLPVTREFNWSQIERQIRQAEQASSPAVPAGWAWKRWLMPFAGVAAIVCAGLIAREELQPPTYDDVQPGDNAMEAVTFHDQSANMTVIWLQDPASATPAAAAPQKTASAPISDPGEIELE